MAVSGARIKALVAKYRLQSEVVGVSLLAIIAALAVGTSARRQAAPLLMERTRLRAQEQEVTSFRASFQPATEQEWASRIPDTLAFSVDADSRIGLTQMIALRAEAGGLRDVRVHIAAPDSVGVPASDLPDGTHLASYTLTIDGSGNFAAILALMNRLPMSVAIQRVSAAQGPNGLEHFRIVLAVYESAGATQHG
jgi:hypothetical protein